MADPRTFTLIGEFRDDITPKLESINTQLDKLKNKFIGNASNKQSGFRGATADIGKLVSAHKHLSLSIKEVNTHVQTLVGSLMTYRSEMGKAARASYAFQRANQKILGGSSLSTQLRASNDQLERQVRLLNAAAGAQQRYTGARNRAPRTQVGYGGGGGYFGPPPAYGGRSPRSPRKPGGAIVPYRGGYPGNIPSAAPRSGGGGGAADDIRFGAGSYVGGMVGAQLGGMIQSSIVKGFQIGTSLMQKPFTFFASRFGERIRDELDDLTAAGGFYAVSRRMDQPFLKSMTEAIQYQQDMNATFAKMAAALPGVTHEYVQVSKRIGDTVARVVANDLPKAMARANEIRATDEGRRFYGEQIRADDPDAMKKTITTLIGDLTKTTVLAGQGGSTGHGGMRGAYGLPALAERMIAQDTVSIGQFQRYAAVFSNPMIADAMNRHIEAINKTAAGTMERMDAIRAMFAEIITPEFVEALRMSFDGIYRALESSLFDPDVGLFSWSRQFQEMGRRMNAYGQYLNKANEVVTNADDAAMESLGLFETLKDIFAYTGQVLEPVLANLPLVWDPLKRVVTMLQDAREITAKFANSFNFYRDKLKAYAESIDQASGDKIMGTLDFRASLQAINNLLRKFNVIGMEEFTSIGKMLMDPDANLGAIMKTQLKQFFSSDIAKDIGEFLGELLGTILSEVGAAMNFLTEIGETSGFAKGFANGFKEAGGFKAIQDIFTGVFKLMFEAFKTALVEMPALTLTLGALALLPTIIAASVGKMTEMAVRFVSKKLDGFVGQTLKQVKTRVSSFFNRGAAPAAGAADDIIETTVRVVDNAGDAGQAALKAGNLRLPPGQVPLLPPGPGGPVNPTPMPQYKPGGPIVKSAGGPLQTIGGALTNAANVLKSGASNFTRFWTNVGAALRTGGIKFINFLQNISKVASKIKGGFGANFGGFFKGILGKLSIFGAVITSIVSLFQGKDFASALADGAGPLLGAALGAALIPFLGPIGPLVGSAIGGFVGNLDAVKDTLAVTFKSIFGSFQGGMNVVVELFRLIVSPVTALLKLIPGVNDDMDALRIILAPIPLAFAALEVGLKGLALVIAKVRNWFVQRFGSAEEKKESAENEKALNEDFQRTKATREAQLDLESNLKKNYNNYLYELKNSENMDKHRRLRMEAYVAEAEKRLKIKDTYKSGDAPESKKDESPDKKPEPAKPVKPDIPTPKPEQYGPPVPAAKKEFDHAKTTAAVREQALKGIPENFAGLKRHIDEKSKKDQAAHKENTNTIRTKAAQDMMWLGQQITNLFTKKKDTEAERAAKEEAGKNQRAMELNAALKGLQDTNNNQLGNIYSGIQHIFSLLSSGSLRVISDNPAGSVINNITNSTTSTTNNTTSGIPTVSSYPVQPGKPIPSAIFNAENWAKGGLGDAIASEMKNKPSGSHLVVANSSETVIPAAGGYGMEAFMDFLKSSFGNVHEEYSSLASGVNKQYGNLSDGLADFEKTSKANFTEAEKVSAGRYKSTQELLDKFQMETFLEFAMMDAQLKQLADDVASSNNMFGGLFGGGGGGGMALGSGYGSAGGAIAGQLGTYIKQTGGAPGSIHEHPQHGGVKGRHAPGSYHYSGRAIDIGAYAHEQAGVIARIKQFNAKMGVQPVEFLHAGNDPNHQDHVHVAYALGPQNPAYFPSLHAAQSWENSMVPGSVKVASVTGNSAEGFGGETNVNNYITINQLPGQDPEELASLVALRIGEAVADARAANIFV